MIHRVLIPQAFENMEEATIGEWLVAEGQTVAVGDALCELITEKTTFQFPSDFAGTFRKIVAPEKAVVPVGALIAYIGDAAEELPEVPEQASATRPAAEVAPSLSVPSLNVFVPATSAGPVTSAGAGSRVRATPAARRAAKDRGLAIEDVAARFPGKVIGEEDVRNYSA